MTQNGLAVLETYLKDIIVSEETITANVELREHIFEIKDSEKTLGFISLYDLKAYVSEHDEEAKNYSIKNIDTDEWKNVYEHPFFQRRKPQLVSLDTLKDADDLEFFILQKGQKTGPYERFELMEKIESREILLSDLASFNGGHTWIKLFQVDGFDRRTLRDNDQLPGMPSSEFLNRPSEFINNIGETTDAITSLAFLGNQKKGKTLERERSVSYKDEMNKGASATSTYKWLLIASVLGIIYFLFNIKSHLSSPFGPTPANPVGEQSEMLTPIEDTGSFNDKPYNRPSSNGVNDQRRTGKFETRNLTPIRPAARKSFMETKSFKEGTGNAGPNSAEDSNYYYDNNTPMELDPIREQISKENFENGGEPSAAPNTDTLFNQEVSN